VCRKYAADGDSRNITRDEFQSVVSIINSINGKLCNRNAGKSFDRNATLVFSTFSADLVRKHWLTFLLESYRSTCAAADQRNSRDVLPSLATSDDRYGENIKKALGEFTASKFVNLIRKYVFRFQDVLTFGSDEDKQEVALPTSLRKFFLQFDASYIDSRVVEMFQQLRQSLRNTDRKPFTPDQRRMRREKANAYYNKKKERSLSASFTQENDQKASLSDEDKPLRKRVRIKEENQEIMDTTVGADEKPLLVRKRSRGPEDNLDDPQEAINAVADEKALTRKRSRVSDLEMASVSAELAKVAGNNS